MFGTESQIDASFYRLIHELVPAGKTNRRQGSRQPFFADHRIAPDRGSGFPDDSQFARVRCFDLTRAGFSFFLPSRPDFKKLVAAFGDPPGVIYVGAEVLHCERVLVHSFGVFERLEGASGEADHQGPAGQPAMQMVLVGCRFTERLQRPAAGG